MGWLSQRHWQPEIMDQPGLHPDEHVQALRGLSRINFWSRSTGILWPPLRDLAREMSPRPVRVLDLATGAGDAPIRLWHKARRSGLPLELAGCDISPVAVRHARDNARQAGADVTFFEYDALRGELLRDYDVVIASFFLHHQPSDDQARLLLRRMGDMASRMVLVHDLIRGPFHLFLVHVVTRLLSASPIVHTDGVRSLKAAFTRPEVRQLAAEAGLDGATVEWRWPFRLLLTWRRTADQRAWRPAAQQHVAASS